MNPSAERQRDWLIELEDLILAIDDGRVPSGRRSEWLSTIRKDIDHLRKKIFLQDHFPENRSQFMRVEKAFTQVKAVDAE